PLPDRTLVQPGPDSPPSREARLSANVERVGETAVQSGSVPAVGMTGRDPRARIDVLLFGVVPALWLIVSGYRVASGFHKAGLDSRYAFLPPAPRGRHG